MSNTTDSPDNTRVQDELGMAVFVYTRVLGTLIIVLNGFVLVCLRVIRHNIPPIYALQITCLCLIDILTGVSVMVSAYLQSDWFTENLTRCALGLVFTISTQSTALYNVMAIGINRFAMLIRTRPRPLTQRRMVLFTILALLSSILLCSLPYLFFIQPVEGPGMSTCNSSNLFKSNSEIAATVFFVAYLLPLVVTNVLYLSLFAVLRRKRQRIRPAISNAGTELRSSSQRNMRSTEMTTTTTHHVTSQGIGAVKSTGQCQVNIVSSVEGPSSSYACADSRLNAAVTTDDCSKESMPIQCRNPVTAPAIPKDALKQATIGNSNLGFSTDVIEPATEAVAERIVSATEIRTTVPTPQERLVLQKKPIVLFGLILLFFNVFTWFPLLTLFFGEDYSSDTKAVLFTTFSCNSLVNPIIYTVQLAEFRGALLSTILSCVRRFWS